MNYFNICLAVPFFWDLWKNLTFRTVFALKRKYLLLYIAYFLSVIYHVFTEGNDYFSCLLLIILIPMRILDKHPIEKMKCLTLIWEDDIPGMEKFAKRYSWDQFLYLDMMGHGIVLYRRRISVQMVKKISETAFLFQYWIILFILSNRQDIMEYLTSESLIKYEIIEPFLTLGKYEYDQLKHLPETGDGIEYAIGVGLLNRKDVEKIWGYSSRTKL